MPSFTKLEFPQVILRSNFPSQTLPWKSNHHFWYVGFWTASVLVEAYHLPRGITIFKMVVGFQGLLFFKVKGHIVVKAKRLAWYLAIRRRISGGFTKRLCKSCWTWKNGKGIIDLLFLPYFIYTCTIFRHMTHVHSSTQWKINMAPKHGGLEDHFPLQVGNF